MSKGEQLTLDDAPEAEHMVTLGAIARDMLDLAREQLGITGFDQALKLELEQKLAKRAEDRPPHTVVSLAAEYLMLELVFGLDFLKDPGPAVDLSEDSWVYTLARIGAHALLDQIETEYWTEKGDAAAALKMLRESQTRQ